MGSVYESFLINNNFVTKLKRWERLYKNKKVILYGCGLLFDEVIEKYDLKSKLNIVAVCDVRFESSDIEEYAGFKTVKPSELKTIEYDCLIFTVFDHLTCLNYLNTFDFFDENKKFHYINEQTIIQKIKLFLKKIGIFQEYFKETKDVYRALKYLFTCNYVEYNSKRNYLLVLNRLLKKVANNEKIKIIFIVESNQKWGWQSVYDEFKKDARFELLLVTLPLTTRFKHKIYPQKDDIKFFTQLGMPIIDGYNEKTQTCINLEELGADIIFYTHPWFVDVHKIPPALTSTFALTCAISYGFNVAESRVWATTTPKNFCGNLWTMFSESKWHKSFYEKGTKLKGKDILYTTGYPKMDAYKQPIDGSFEKIWKDENHSKPRIIYAPHHSIERDGGFCASNFVIHSKFFLEFIKKHPEWDFVIKPHPVLKSKCVATGFMTEEEYDLYIEEWKRQPNSNAYELGNYYDLFKTSDVLITDCFSFLGEYFVSSKPIVLLESKERILYNGFGNKLKTGMYKPQSVDEIELILKDILNEKKDVLEIKRKEIISKDFFIPPQGSANYIVSYIKNKLRMN